MPVPIGKDAFLGLSTIRDMNIAAEQMRQKSIYDDMMRQKEQQDRMALQQQQYRLAGENAIALESARGTNRQSLFDAKAMLGDSKARASALLTAAGQLEDRARAMAGFDPDTAASAMNEASRIRQYAMDLQRQGAASLPPQSPTATTNPNVQHKPEQRAPSRMLMTDAQAASAPITVEPQTNASPQQEVSPSDVWRKRVEVKATQGLVTKSFIQKAMELGFGSDATKYTPEQMASVNNAMQEDKKEVATAAAKVGVEAAKEKEMIDRRTNALKSLKDTESAINIVENIKSKAAGLFTSTSTAGAAGEYWGTRIQEWTHMVPAKKKNYLDYVQAQAPALIKGLGSASGVLSDQDINYGMKTAPQFGDEAKVAAAKINALERALKIAAQGVQRMANATPDQVPEIIAETKVAYYAALDFGKNAGGEENATGETKQSESQPKVKRYNPKTGRWE